MNGRPRGRAGVGLRLALLGLFAVAFAQIEATVVWYIRSLLDWIPVPSDLGQKAMEQVPPWLIRSEQWREAATMVVLVAVAVLVGRRWRERLGAFLYAFAVWDILYYVWLKVLIGWPESLQTTDCLFLIPSPWLAPVWFPVVVSLCLLVISLPLLGVGKRGA